MGRRRRRVIRIVKKKLPTVFVCPRCGEEAVRVTIAKDTGHATVLCALCNLKDDFPAHPAAQAIDVYSYFTDRFYGVKNPRAIIPREREFLQAPVDDESEEEATVTTSPVEEPAAEPAPLQVQPGRPEPEPALVLSPVQEPVAQASTQSATSSEPMETAGGAKEDSEKMIEPTEEAQKESEEDNEPFADILENKDKKRYSSQPLPQQSTEQTS